MKYRITWENYDTGAVGTSRILRSLGWSGEERRDQPYMEEAEVKRLVRTANRYFKRAHHTLEEV